MNIRKATETDYDKVWEMEFQMRSAQVIGKDVGEVLLAEMEIFPTLGWKLWIEKQEENGAFLLA